MAFFINRFVSNEPLLSSPFAKGTDAIVLSFIFSYLKKKEAE